MYWAVSSQVRIENQIETKHEESILITCLDEGSIPSGSTKMVSTKNKKPVIL